jgi:asparagine synthase (glutamine-hydrolysing)
LAVTHGVLACVDATQGLLMCGIVGVAWAPAAVRPNASNLEAAVQALAHRGPDARSFHHADNVSLGHTRLSIIDVPDGFQPMPNEDESVWTIYNGEIWNYRHVRGELERSGHVFRSNCDTEVVVHAYEEWGDDVVHHLDGMYAFAVWDERRGRLLLARDRLGKKPLYVHVGPDSLAFGSDARSVLLAAGVSPRVDADAVAQFLFQRYVNAPRTMFAGVEKLPPATLLTYDGESVQRRSYWSLAAEEPEPLETGRLRELLKGAVEKRLMSDVPLGLYLSGGVDSAAVLGLMRELGLAHVTAFTIGFDDPVHDERRWAQETARFHEADWHSVVVGADDFVAALPRLAWYRDEPIAEPSEIPLLLLSEFASRHVTVVLSGEGGDELFGGYPKYRAERFLRPTGRLGARMLRALATVQNRRPSHRALDRAVETMAIRDGLLRWASWFRSFAPEEIATVLAPGMPRPSSAEAYADALRDVLDPYQSLDPGRQMMIGDLLSYLPDNLLLRADKVMMAASIEGRMPFLDRELVEAVHRLPSRRRSGWRGAKQILREAVADLVPPSVLAQPKRGFPVPVSRLLIHAAESLPERLLLSERSLDRGIFDGDALRMFVRAPGRDAPGRDLKLFTLCALELWLRVNVDELRVTPPASLDELLDADLVTLGAPA